MKRSLLTLGVMAWAILPARSWAAPRIQCKEPVYDFGVAWDQDAVSHTFLVRNIGDADLVIDLVKTSCGCTTASLTNRTVAPGASVEIDARLTLRGRRGDQRKSIYLHSNDPVNAICKLEIAGTIRRAVELIPEQVFFSGSELGGQARTVDVRFSDEHACRVTGIQTDAVAFCTFELATVTESRAYRVTVRLRPDQQLPTGLSTGKAVLLTDHPKTPRIELPVMVQKQPEIFVVPPQIHITAVPSRVAPVKRYLLLRSNEKSPVTLVSVSPPSDKIQAISTLLRAGMYRIEISNLVPDQALDGQAIRVLVRKADGSEVTLEVPIKVTWVLKR